MPARKKTTVAATKVAANTPAVAPARAARKRRAIPARAAPAAAAPATAPTETRAQEIIDRIDALISQDGYVPQIPAWNRYDAIRNAAYARDLEAYKAAKTENPDQKLVEPMLAHYGIEDARVRRILDKYGLNSAITNFIHPIIEAATAAAASTAPADAQPAAKDGAKPKAPKIKLNEQDEDRCAIARSDRVRVGAEVASYLRAFCEEIANDMIHIGVESASHAKRTNIYASDVFAYGGKLIDATPFHLLFCHLPSFEAMRAKVASRDARILAANVADQCISRFSRSLTDNARADYRVMRDHIGIIRGSRADDETRAPEDAEESKTGKNARFTHYIRHMMQTIIRSSDKYKGLHISSGFVAFANDVLTEFVHLVAAHVSTQTKMRNIQTVSRKMVAEVIRNMMATPEEVIMRSIASVRREKTRRMVPKLDAAGKPIKDKKGKRVMEEQEINDPVVVVRECGVDALLATVAPIDLPEEEEAPAPAAAAASK